MEDIGRGQNDQKREKDKKRKIRRQDNESQ